MVRSKSSAVVSGRKQRIEGIVKNLSAKISTKGVNSVFDGVVRRLSVSSGHPLSPSSQQRIDGQCSTITESTNSVYHLPSELEFSGIVSSQPLSRGKQFGPFIGRITSKEQQNSFHHSLFCQIPDVAGNIFSLCLLTRDLVSHKWLQCLKRCTARSSYNVVAYNTPYGVLLETVCDVGVGGELCVAYDKSYDTIDVPMIENDVGEIAVQEVPAEEIMENSRDMREPYVVPACDAETTYSASVSAGHSTVDANATIGESSQNPESTYSVLTADVTENIDSLKEEEEHVPSLVITDKHVASLAVLGRDPLTAVYEDNEESKPTKSWKKSDQKGKKGPPKPYRCHSCKKQFKTFEEKQHHLNTNHTTECPVCYKTYSRAYLKEHMLFHLESSRVTCPICGKIFSSISNLRKHQKKHTKRTFPTIVVAAVAVAADKGAIHQCSECPKAFKSAKYLESHRKKHVRVIPISCSECHEVFVSKSLLRRHNAVIHKGKKPYSCKHCDKTFTQSGNLSRHCKNTHADTKEVRERAIKKKYLCRRRGCCQKAFTNRDLFIKHLEQHSGNRSVFPCLDCNSVFSSSSNLSKHKKTQHVRVKIKIERETVKFTCDFCKAPFKNEVLYQRHLRNHKISKVENKCEQCGKMFANRSGLLKHVRLLRCSVTKKLKPPKAGKTYECLDCSKTFLTASDLRTHRRCHTIVNPFVCEICGKSFNQPGNLGKHKRHVHQGVPRPKEKPRTKKVTCKICNKICATPGGLHVHMRHHLGVRSFKCEHCGAAFTQSGLKKHVSKCKKLAVYPHPPVADQPLIAPLVAPLTSNDNTEHVPMPSVPTTMAVDEISFDNNNCTFAKMDDDVDEFAAPPGSPVF